MFLLDQPDRTPHHAEPDKIVAPDHLRYHLANLAGALIKRLHRRLRPAADERRRLTEQPGRPVLVDIESKDAPAEPALNHHTRGPDRRLGCLRRHLLR